jgi:hypothetical protein
MVSRRLIPFVLVGVFLSLGASYRTQNFVVEAPTPEIAQQIGQYAEHYRREKARLWLGREMTPWSEPCPLKVQVTGGGSGGATSFAFDRGQVLGQHMNIEGRLDRLLASVLPHEVTHTVFAYHFRQPVPRWADEGGSVLSEDEPERKHHERLVRQVLQQRRAMPLRRLFSLREYPRDVMVLYAQGYSVTAFLVARSSRPAFLNFVAAGMTQGWDQAIRAHYRFNSVEELEQAWIRSLYTTPQDPPTQLASRPSAPPAGGERVVVRLTAPPVSGGRQGPIVRGVAPGPEDGYRAPVQPTSASRPTVSPYPQSCPGGTCPTQPMNRPPRVQLLPPQPVQSPLPPVPTFPQ